MGPLLFLLAKAATDAALTGGKMYMQQRAQDKADKRNASSAAINAAQQSLTGEPALLPQSQQQAGETPFGYLSDKMQQELFDQMFKGLFGPPPTVPAKQGKTP